jgi:thiosulfate dehydrogenase [quinone] large subunit
MSNYREIAYALLRVTLGVIFLTTGIGKLIFGIGNFAAGLEQEFAGKLPMFMVIPFGYVLPFLEVAVGILLVLGLFSAIALVFAELLLMSLTFGMMVVNNSAVVAGNLSYVLIVFVLLWLVDSNRYSVDRLLERKVPVGGS